MLFSVHIMSEKQLKESGEKRKMNVKKLQALTKHDLIEKCKEQNINCYGTKFDMIQRLLASEKNGVINEIKHSIPPIIIEKDPTTGKHIHVQTSLIFDPQEKRVVAKKGQDGSIHPLQYDDIKQCLKYKFRYLLPENLAVDDHHEKISGDENGKKSSSEMASRDEVLEKRLKEIEEETSSPNDKKSDDDTPLVVDDEDAEGMDEEED